MFVGKLMSLLFHMLSRFVIPFLPRSKCLLIVWLQSPSPVILEPKKIKSVIVFIFPHLFASSDRTRCHDLVFWILSFKPAFSLYSFTLIKRLFSSSSLSTVKVVLFAYLLFLIFLLGILMVTCASSSLAVIQVFHMMHSAYKLNKQGDNIQPYHILFPILNSSIVTWLG